MTKALQRQGLWSRVAGFFSLFAWKERDPVEWVLVIAVALTALPVLLVLVPSVHRVERGIGSVPYPRNDGRVMAILSTPGTKVRTWNEEQFSVLCDSSQGGNSTATYEHVTVDTNNGAMRLDYALRDGKRHTFVGVPFAGVFVDLKTPPAFYDVTEFRKLNLLLAVDQFTVEKGVKVVIALAERGFPLQESATEKYSFPRYEIAGDDLKKYLYDRSRPMLFPVSIDFEKFKQPHWVEEQGSTYKFEGRSVYRVIVSLEGPGLSENTGGNAAKGTTKNDVRSRYPIEGFIEVGKIEFSK